jgi:hypothetical protein
MTCAALGVSSQNAFAGGEPIAVKEKLKKNVVLLTVDLGIFEGYYHQGKENCKYFEKFFPDFKKNGDVTYIDGMYQPGIGGGHDVEHCVYTTMKFTDRSLYPNRKFVSLDQHIRENAVQTTRNHAVFHRAGKGGQNVSWNSQAQAAPAFSGLNSFYHHLFMPLSLSEEKFKINQKRYILKDLYSNVRRKDRGTEEEKRMARALDYKLEQLDTEEKWLKVRKPRPKMSFKADDAHEGPSIMHLDKNFELIFNALKEKQTQTVLFQMNGSCAGTPGITHGAHTISHHGYYAERVAEQEILDGYYLSALARFLEKLKGEKKMFDDTIVLFTSGMACSAAHSGINVPAFLFGGGFKHKPRINCRDAEGKLIKPTTHLYSSILKQAGFRNTLFSGNTEVMNELFEA